MKEEVWYIAGPMSGLPQFNVPMFQRVAGYLRKIGYNVISPAELDSPEMQEQALASVDGNLADLELGTGETWGDVLARDVKVIADTVTDIVLLPGWENSRGARLEAFVSILCGHSLHIWEDRFPNVRPATDAEVKEILP